MRAFKGTDFNAIYYEMLQYAYYKEGEFIQSRVGEVKDLGPAYFEISEDEFRLVHLHKRAINPFFALTEFSWILNGSNKVDPLEYFISGYKKYSDDEETLNGAYGYRLRRYFDRDQIEDAVRQLKENPNTRRVVLTMWSVDDLSANSNDLPCNISLLLKIRKGKLDITILNRSNDIYLGVPYNVFVFHLLQLYLAQRIECKIGVQRHFTDSLHLYKRDLNNVKQVLDNNSFQSIKNTKTHNKSFDIYKYVHENHTAVLDRDFSKIKSDEIRNLFIAIQNFKNNEDINTIINSLPNNILGYISYQWLKNFSKKEIFENYFTLLEENILSKEIKLNFDGLVYENEEVIKTSLKEFIKVNKDKHQQFVKILTRNNTLFSLNSSVVNEKLLSAIFLSLIVCKARSIYSPSVKDSIMNIFTKFCLEIDLNIDDVIHLTLYESKFLYIINE